ncbi:hypothetical protein Xoosp13_63 [Xanthomonas phage Xoo-sp13]|nr:hypothetical protein Xoosp13_63 [Xanthomonas phage Xoo-sp13]
MCLIINDKYHTDRTPKVATQPILVWKVLESATEKQAVSPYQGATWRFGVQKKVNFSFTQTGDITSVGAGLHAFISKDCRSISRMVINWYHVYATVYPAVIPVGAEYFIGSNDEIVSTQLTVYKTVAECLAAFGATEFAPGIPLNSLMV